MYLECNKRCEVHYNALQKLAGLLLMKLYFIFCNDHLRDFSENTVVQSGKLKTSSGASEILLMIAGFPAVSVSVLTNLLPTVLGRRALTLGEGFKVQSEDISATNNFAK